MYRDLSALQLGQQDEAAADDTQIPRTLASFNVTGAA
jgi:hypothetical protein